MKIQDINQRAQAAQVLQYVNQQAKVNTNEQGAVNPDTKVITQVGDRVDLSPSSRMIKKIEAAALSAPDTRAGKVAALKKQVESGTYQVNSDELAGKMLKDSLIEMSH
jgi:negative regulator of flagellin synthesis FlgM